MLQEDFARDHDDRDTAARERVAHRDLQHPWELLTHAHKLAVHAALAEQFLRMGLLEVAAADLLSRDVSGDREHRYPGAVGLEQSVDQVQVPGTAASRADGELLGHRRFAGGRERSALLVANVLPDELAVAPECLGEPVDRVAGQPVHAADAGRLQHLHDHICDGPV